MCTTICESIDVNNYCKCQTCNAVYHVPCIAQWTNQSGSIRCTVCQANDVRVEHYVNFKKTLQAAFVMGLTVLIGPVFYILILVAFYVVGKDEFLKMIHDTIGRFDAADNVDVTIDIDKRRRKVFG